MPNKHKWTCQDDCKILFVYKFGWKECPEKFNSAQKMANEIGAPIASIKMRIKNFQSVDGQGGLENYAKMTQNVYSKYNNLSPPDLKGRIQTRSATPKGSMNE